MRVSENIIACVEFVNREKLNNFILNIQSVYFFKDSRCLASLLSCTAVESSVCGFLQRNA